MKKLLFLTVIAVMLTIVGWHTVPTAEASTYISGTCWAQHPNSGRWQQIAFNTETHSCALALKRYYHYRDNSGFIWGFLTHDASFRHLDQWVVVHVFRNDVYLADDDGRFDWHSYNLNDYGNCDTDPNDDIGCVVQ